MAYGFSLSLGLRLSFLLLTLHHVLADVYMHNPRGSNDRLRANSANRNNANRLFDSQNNAKGGYNVGELPYHNGASRQDQQYAMNYFMSGSRHRSSPDKRWKSHLVIEWTNQHGCGHGDLDCNVVLQYMCQNNRYESLDTRNNKDVDTIRNGEISSGQTNENVLGSARLRIRHVTSGDNDATIPYANVANIHNRVIKKRLKEGQASLNRGLHEPWEWYDKCRKRPRNRGLFTADQNVQDNAGSTKTRQNPNGNRHGYECPEERDYYPYWHPSDWKDMAVFTTKKEHCDFYEYFSFNRHPKGECVRHYPNGGGFKHYSEVNNPERCTGPDLTWVMFHSFIDFKDEYKDKASCERASTKDVPLVWGVPYMSEYVDGLEIDEVTRKPKASCLVQPPRVDCRVSPLSRPNHLGNVQDAENMNYTWIIPYFPSQTEKRCVVRIRYNISTYDYDGNRTFSDKNGANSPVKNNPEVAFNTKSEDIKFKLQLAVNTAQFGRTFQDRSHVMILRPRKGTSIADDIAVYNLNVRGKRGNIVQVYPAVEYDFVPKDLNCTSNDAVHIQWTGSSSNPGNNDGQGRAGSDKSNMVEIDDSGINVKFKTDGKMISDAKLLWTPDKYIKSMEDVGIALASSGFDFLKGKQQRLGAVNRRLQFQDELDNSPASFSVVLSFSPGSYKYMGTRNNNFSNRNQKASITVATGSNSPSTRATTTPTPRRIRRPPARRSRARRSRARRTRPRRTRARRTRARRARARRTRARRARRRTVRRRRSRRG